MRWHPLGSDVPEPTAFELGNLRASGGIACVPLALRSKVMQHRYRDLVRHVQVSKNFGRLGGWLRVEFLCFESGDPTGHSFSRVEHPVA